MKWAEAPFKNKGRDNAVAIRAYLISQGRWLVHCWNDD